MSNHKYKKIAPQTAESEREEAERPEYESRWDDDTPRMPVRREHQEEEPVPESKKSASRSGTDASHEVIWLASYFILLLLAPLIQEGIEYTVGGKSYYMSAYWPLLVCAVPILIAAVVIRPASLWFFVFAPLLPVSAYFALQNIAVRPWLVGFAVLGFFGMMVYHVFHLSRQPQEDEEEHSSRRQTSKRDHRRGMLTFGVTIMTVMLMIPAGLGYLLPVPEKPEEMPDPSAIGLDTAILMLSEPWPADFKSRDHILQSLLAWECISEHPLHKDHICSIDDPKIKAITKDGKRALTTARHTKDDELETRVELICYISALQKKREWDAEKEKWGGRITNDDRNHAAAPARDRTKDYMKKIHSQE